MFRAFVLEHRKPTGRTLQPDGRYHGSQFHLDSSIQYIKLQTGVEAARRKTQPATNAVLSNLFWKAMEAESPSVKRVGESTLHGWWTEDFCSTASPYGHTTVFPHVTDACAFCTEHVSRINSIEASLRKHALHTEDAGSLERQKIVAELKMELQGLKAEKEKHRDAARAAHQHHKERVEENFVNYVGLCSEVRRAVAVCTIIIIIIVIITIKSFRLTVC